MQNKYKEIINLYYKKLSGTRMTPKYIDMYKNINIETLGDLFLTTIDSLEKNKIRGKALHEAKYIMEEHGFILKDK